MAGPTIVIVDSDDEDEGIEDPPAAPPLSTQSIKEEGNDAALKARTLKALREVFGLRAFRSPQQAVITHVLKGNSALVLVSEPLDAWLSLWGASHPSFSQVSFPTFHTPPNPRLAASDGRRQVALLPAAGDHAARSLSRGQSAYRPDGGSGASAAGAGHRGARLQVRF